MGFAPHVTSSKVPVATAFTPSNSVESLEWELTFMYDLYQYVKIYSGNSPIPSIQSGRTGKY
jgi:hypothetical protein